MFLRLSASIQQAVCKAVCIPLSIQYVYATNTDLTRIDPVLVKGERVELLLEAEANS